MHGQEINSKRLGHAFVTDSRASVHYHHSLSNPHHQNKQIIGTYRGLDSKWMMVEMDAGYRNCPKVNILATQYKEQRIGKNGQNVMTFAYSSCIQTLSLRWTWIHPLATGNKYRKEKGQWMNVQPKAQRTAFHQSLIESQAPVTRK